MIASFVNAAATIEKKGNDRDKRKKKLFEYNIWYSEQEFNTYIIHIIQLEESAARYIDMKLELVKRLTKPKPKPKCGHVLLLL